jgi:hypothetical protein
MLTQFFSYSTLSFIVILHHSYHVVAQLVEAPRCQPEGRGFHSRAGRAQTLHDYYDFLRRTRRKLEDLGTRSRSVGKYLSVVIVDARQ